MRERPRGRHCAQMRIRGPLDALAELLVRQDGVVARRQLHELGVSPHDLKRMLRRRELRRVHPGVFVNHTGPLTRRQREWVAVLAVWPAALTGRSALPVATPAGVQVAVAHGRTVSAPSGVTVTRMTDLDQRVSWQRSPPRVQIEHATIDEMSDLVAVDDIAEAFATLARVAMSRQTTLDRLLSTLAARHRVAGRRLIRGMITDVRDGVCSVLERGYRERVERAHGLPGARRQHASRASGSQTYQDVRYDLYGAIIELDGLAFHGSAAARDADALRDLAELAMSEAVTTRLTYGLVFTHQCQTARLIAVLLRRRGWTGQLTECPRCPGTAAAA